MAADNLPITQLPLASTLLGSEPIPTVQGDETRTPSTVTTLYAEKTTVQTTPAEIATYVNTVVPPAGAVAMYAGKTAPTGWLICDGSSLQDAVKYGKLYDAIGTVYGGTGKNNFKIPDMQGKVAVGVGAGRSIGAVGGTEAVTLTLAQIPPHRHAFQGGSVTINDATNGSQGGLKNDAGGSLYGFTDKQTINMNSTVLAKAATAHDNMQPYVVMNYIIKY